MLQKWNSKIIFMFETIKFNDSRFTIITHIALCISITNETAINL